ncbi:golgin subfamily A member 6C-like [Cavia porcellus]|uniref:golgin subfamily A member 6C-like n=1 Tax=Cavia porcellus TaxID=10141 RepID=UPI002FE373A0
MEGIVMKWSHPFSPPCVGIPEEIRKQKLAAAKKKLRQFQKQKKSDHSPVDKRVHEFKNVRDREAEKLPVKLSELKNCRERREHQYSDHLELRAAEKP